jgi:capsular polysaccharide biosynthesis protein
MVPCGKHSFASSHPVNHTHVTAVLRRVLPSSVLQRLEPLLRKLHAVALRMMTAAMRPLALLPGRAGPPRNVEHDVGAFAALPGVDLDVGDASCTLRHVVPPGADDVYPEYRIQSRVELPATYVLTIADGRVWGADASVVGPGDTFFPGVANRFVTHASGYPILRKALLPPVTRVRGRVAVIATAYADYYYHWMTEILPRCGVLGDALRTADHVVTPSTNAFQTEALARLGVDPGKVLTPSDEVQYQADQLIVPSLAGIMNHVRPSSVGFVRRLFGVNHADAAPRRGRRLYVSRQGEARRRVLNEPEVVALLTAHGFEVVAPGGLTVAEQAQLFAQADIVIGPHGGGLTNMIFCAPGTRVIELISPVAQVLCYWTLATSAQLEYELSFGRGPLASKSSRPRYALWNDIEVDCEQLGRRLEHLLERSA